MATVLFCRVIETSVGEAGAEVNDGKVTSGFGNNGDRKEEGSENGKRT
jgi:hypothetical protein